MSRAWRPVRARPFAARYVRVLGVFFVLQALGGGAVKVVQGRGEDLPHAVLHLVSGLVALWVTSPRRASSAPPRFAVAFGLLYLTLGVLGRLEVAALAPFHLELADHVFHVAVGAATFAVGARRAVRSGPPEVSAKSLPRREATARNPTHPGGAGPIRSGTARP